MFPRKIKFQRVATIPVILAACSRHSAHCSDQLPKSVDRKYDDQNDLPFQRKLTVRRTLIKAPKWGQRPRGCPSLADERRHLNCAQLLVAAIVRSSEWARLNG